MKKLIFISIFLLVVVFIVLGLYYFEIDYTKFIEKDTGGQEATKQPNHNQETEESNQESKDSKVSNNHVCGDKIQDSNGNEYKTVKIGSQCWMSENLNVGNMVKGSKEMEDNNKIEKYCYNNKESNCESLGGLYQWNEAVQYNNAENTRGICPSGWHIPSDDEWHTLESFLREFGVNCEPDRTGWACDPAGKKLKDKNSLEFNALMSGIRFPHKNFDRKDEAAYFWTSTDNRLAAWTRRLNKDYSTIVRDEDNKKGGYSIRCIKD